MEASIGVIGLGYVGLPLALAAHRIGLNVIGIDSNLDKIEFLKIGISPVDDVLDSDLKLAIPSKSFKISADYSEIQNCNIVVICVPTPITVDGKPDLSSLTNAVVSASKYIQPGVLIIIESTIATGTTRNYVYPLILANSRLDSSDLLLAFSPERIDPSNKTWNLLNTPKLVSGISRESKNRAVNFYKKLNMAVVECDSVEIAETAKLLENSFRFINISFVNELSIFCNKLNIDINQVISAAATKPYGFMPFYPSIGVGGHCIPIDPLYLAYAAENVGVPTKMIELAKQINQDMPNYFVEKAEAKISGLKGKRVLVIGVAYKPNTSDVRETAVENLITRLKEKGARVFWHDELVKEWNGERSTSLSSDFDLAILATPHDYLNLEELGEIPILNTRSSI